MDDTARGTADSDVNPLAPVDTAPVDATAPLSTPPETPAPIQQPTNVTASADVPKASIEVSNGVGTAPSPATIEPSPKEPADANSTSTTVASASGSPAAPVLTPPSAPSTDVTPSPKRPPAHVSAVHYLENALLNAVKELDTETVRCGCGIENDVKALKSFLNYQFNVLKSKIVT